MRVGKAESGETCLHWLHMWNPSGISSPTGGANGIAPARALAAGFFFLPRLVVGAGEGGDGLEGPAMVEVMIWSGWGGWKEELGAVDRDRAISLGCCNAVGRRGQARLGQGMHVVRKRDRDAALSSGLGLTRWRLGP